jgi:aspartate 1-decarboxylase
VEVDGKVYRLTICKDCLAEYEGNLKVDGEVMEGSGIAEWN